LLRYPKVLLGVFAPERGGSAGRGGLGRPEGWLRAEVGDGGVEAQEAFYFLLVRACLKHGLFFFVLRVGVFPFGFLPCLTGAFALVLGFFGNYGWRAVLEVGQVIGRAVRGFRLIGLIFGGRGRLVGLLLPLGG